jgi:ribosomal protein L40E
MVTSDDHLICPFCGSTTPLDSKCCQKCGERLIQTCLRCNTENRLDAEYCKACGIKLSQAKLGLTNQRAKEWGQFLCTYYPGYNELWKPQGFGHQIADLCRQITNESENNAQINNQPVSFALPISDRDWCVRNAQMDSTVITYGYVSANTIQLSVYNLATKKKYSVFYEDLIRVIQEGDNIIINSGHGETITLSLRIPRPSKLATAGLLAESFINNVGAKDWADQELSRQNWKPRTEEHRHKFEMADAYRESIFGLFSEIINIVVTSEPLLAKRTKETSNQKEEIAAVLLDMNEAHNNNDREKVKRLIHPDGSRLLENMEKNSKINPNSTSSHNEMSCLEILIRPDGIAEARYRLKVTFNKGSGLRDCEMLICDFLKQDNHKWKLFDNIYSEFEYLDTRIGHDSNAFYQICAKDFIKKLQEYPSESFEITALLDDYHSLNFAKYFEDMLKKAGWKSNGISELSPDEAPNSILVEEPTDKPVYRILLFDMRQLGLIFERRENPNNTNVRIVVGKPNWRE